MLTRSGVAKRLGKSIATVRRLEGHALHPTVDGNGVHRFSDSQVRLLLQRIRSGESPEAAQGDWLSGVVPARHRHRKAPLLEPASVERQLIDARQEVAITILELLLRHQPRPNPVVIEYLAEIIDEE